MTDPTIHGNRASFSASAALSAIGRALSQIKAEDGLTYADLGALLGKSDDQAAKYCEGTAVMDAITFARGKREWGRRFTGYLDQLCIESRPSPLDDFGGQLCIARAALAFAEALQDGTFTPGEVIANRTTLERARDAIDAQLAKISVPLT